MMLNSRRHRRILPATAALALLALLAPACTGGGKAAIKVGAIYPLSGSQGPGGVEEYQGVVAAVGLVNQDGGVDGRHIDLRAIDVGSADAAPGAIASLHQDGVRFVLGSYGSTIALPASKAAAGDGMLYWETGAVGQMTDDGAGSLIFRVPPSGGVLGRSAVQFIAGQLAPLLHEDARTLRFAVANVDDVYGRAVAQGAVGEIRSEGLTFAGQFAYDPQHPDVQATVQRIAAARPDVLFVSAYLEDGIALRRETVRQGLHLVASIGTSSSYCMPAFGASLGADAVGLYASDKPDANALSPNGLSPEARALLGRARSAYRVRFGADMSAPALAGFSAAWALFHTVMPRASSITAADVAQAALGVDLPQGSLPNGSGLAFGKPGEPDAGANLNALSVIWEWTGLNERTVVFPRDFATGAIEPLSIAP